MRPLPPVGINGVEHEGIKPVGFLIDSITNGFIDTVGALIIEHDQFLPVREIGAFEQYRNAVEQLRQLFDIRLIPLPLKVFLTFGENIALVGELFHMQGAFGNFL